MHACLQRNHPHPLHAHADQRAYIHIHCRKGETVSCWNDDCMDTKSKHTWRQQQRYLLISGGTQHTHYTQNSYHTYTHTHVLVYKRQVWSNLACFELFASCWKEADTLNAGIEHVHQASWPSCEHLNKVQKCRSYLHNRSHTVCQTINASVRIDHTLNASLNLDRKSVV